MVQEREIMFKDSGYANFLIHDIILPCLVYIMGIIFLIVVSILKLSPWNVIEIFNNGKYDLLVLEAKFPNTFVIVCEVLLVMLICYLTVRKINKNNEFHRNGTGYLKWPFWILTLVGRLLGYDSINTVNIPIWLQFKIYKSSWWQTRSLDQINIETIEDRVTIEFKEAKNSSDVVNVILVDTYPILGKIPETILTRNDTLIVKRELTSPGNRTFNKHFVRQSIAEINKLYKLPYKSMNIFLSTNPFHTKRIVKGVFRMNGRERHMGVTVFQSIGESHIYCEPHQIIK